MQTNICCLVSYITTAKWNCKALHLVLNYIKLHLIRKLNKINLNVFISNQINFILKCLKVNKNLQNIIYLKLY